MRLNQPRRFSCLLFYIISGTLLVSLLLLRTGVWAAPWQNPHRQTIPTRTPVPGGEEGEEEEELPKEWEAPEEEGPKEWEVPEEELTPTETPTNTPVVPATGGTAVTVTQVPVISTSPLPGAGETAPGPAAASENVVRNPSYETFSGKENDDKDDTFADWRVLRPTGRQAKGIVEAVTGTSSQIALKLTMTDAADKDYWLGLQQRSDQSMESTVWEFTADVFIPLELVSCTLDIRTFIIRQEASPPIRAEAILRYHASTQSWVRLAAYTVTPSQFGLYDLIVQLGLVSTAPFSDQHNMVYVDNVTLRRLAGARQPVAAESQISASTPLPTDTPTPTPTYILVTNTPRPENVFTAAAMAATATALAEMVGTPTPLPPNAVTPVVVTSTSTPANAATAQYIMAWTTAVAMAIGTLTPTPPNMATATPIPILVPVNEPNPTLTPTPTPPPFPDPARMPPGLKGKIAFFSDRYRREGGRGRNQYYIYAIDPDGSNLMMLTAFWPYDLACQLDTFSPDMSQRVFVREGTSERGGKDLELWVQNQADGWTWTLRDNVGHYTKAGSNPPVSFPGYDFDVVWSPDSAHIAYVSTTDGNEEIHVVNKDDPSRPDRRLTINEWESDRHPSYSPDGGQIVFWSNRETGRSQLWIMDADGNNQRRLLESSYNDWDPVWIKW